MKNEPSVLFITPGASKVGGNIFLLNFLKWMKQNSAIPFITIYGHGGAIEEEFAALGKAYRFEQDYENKNLLNRGLMRVSQKMSLRSRQIVKKLAGENIGLIYSNAVTNYHILSALSYLDVPLVSHCHELESVIYRTGIDGFNETKKRTGRFVAASEAVKNNLVKNHAVDSSDIDIVHEFIPIQNYSDAELNTKRSRVRAQLGIPEDAFVVGGSGTLYWRKAPELFILTAREVRKLTPDAPIYFLWVGGAGKEDFKLFEVNFDVEKLGLQERVKFVPHTADPSDHYAALDLFFLTSREDPYPLVCLESAALAKLVMCFENSGGMPEFVEQDCGAIVPYLDIEVAAKTIIQLYKNPSMTKTLGAAAGKKVRERHDIKVAAPRMLAIIEKYLSRATNV
jgi:glycosyltransferase involved in cell wall biosynthesis